MRLVAVAAALAVLAGCSTAPPPLEGPAAPAPDQPPPPYPEVARRYNERIGGVERLWATAVMRLWYTDEEGTQQSEQLEGNLQLIRPDRLLLRFDKVSQTFGYLGSNAERYWWIRSGEGRKAWVGRHENATPGRIAALGLPLHPLDFMDTLGITPLPLTWVSVGAGEAPRVRWSADGRDLVVTVVDGLSRRRLTIDPALWLARRIELVTPDGDAAVVSDLSEYTQVSRGGDRGRAWLATEVNAGVADGSLRLRIRLSGAQTDGRRPRDDAFDFDRLLRAERVEEIVDVDELDPREPRAGRAAGPSPD